MALLSENEIIDATYREERLLVTPEMQERRWVTQEVPPAAGCSRPASQCQEVGEPVICLRFPREALAPTGRAVVFALGDMLPWAVISNPRHAGHSIHTLRRQTQQQQHQWPTVAITLQLSGGGSAPVESNGTAEVRCGMHSHGSLSTSARDATSPTM